MTIKGDDVVEDNETFSITLGNVTNTTAVQDAAITTGASATARSRTMTTAVLSITAPMIIETDVDFAVKFTVTLDKAVEGGFRVAFSHALGTAESSDYTVNTTSPLTFAGTVGENQAISVTIEGDDLVEGQRDVFDHAGGT